MMNEAQKKKAEQAEEDLRNVISTESGLRILGKILKDAGIYKYEKGSFETVLHNNGKREVGVKLLNKLRVLDPSIETKIKGAQDNG